MPVYLHEIIEASPRAAWMFSRAAAIGKYRKDVPVAAWAAAAITAVRHEDCGPCTQLGVSIAERAGVDVKVLRAILTEDPAAMPDDVALAWRFTRATIDHDPGVRRGDGRASERPRSLRASITPHCRRISSWLRPVTTRHAPVPWSSARLRAWRDR